MNWYRVGFWYGPCYLGSILLRSYTPETAREDALAQAAKFGGLFPLPLGGSLVGVELELERVNTPPVGGQS